jgi:hypothetical protein
MNVNICKFKCHYKCSNFRLCYLDGVFLSARIDGLGHQIYMPVKCNNVMLKRRWGITNNEISFIDGEDFSIQDCFRYIYLQNNDFCPYVLEHTMSDIDYENRIKKWKNQQKIKKKLKEQLVKDKKNDIL